MIFEGLRESESGNPSNAYTISALLLTAIATSIDSLVVGFGFGFLNIAAVVALLMIDSVTFLASFGGDYRRLCADRPWGQNPFGPHLVLH